VSALSIKGITKAFGSTPVLRGIDLDIPAGSLTAVLGPSGCGKTTLLRIIAGFAEPDAGVIRFDDRTVAGEGRSVAARDRHVGYVPQEGALFPHLSVAANISFGLKRSARRDRVRVLELLELVGLAPGVCDRFPHELSGGQQQRVALARALAPSPTVVLLDEPFSSLDAGLREDTGRAVSRALRLTGATAVLVTHDQGEALSLADQVAVMREGLLVQVGPPTEVYRRPVDPGVAGFVGGAVLLPGTVSGDVVRCPLGALPVQGSAPAGAVQVLVRPEQLVLGEVGEPATVAEVSYFGHDANVRLDLVGGSSVQARVLGGSVPEVGQEVRLGVRGQVPVFPVAP
jgi:iron(III) transport system ATP-binding protein